MREYIAKNKDFSWCKIRIIGDCVYHSSEFCDSWYNQYETAEELEKAVQLWIDEKKSYGMHILKVNSHEEYIPL